MLGALVRCAYLTSNSLCCVCVHVACMLCVRCVCVCVRVRVCVCACDLCSVEIKLADGLLAAGGDRTGEQPCPALLSRFQVCNIHPQALFQPNTGRTHTRTRTHTHTQRTHNIHATYTHTQHSEFDVRYAHRTKAPSTPKRLRDPQRLQGSPSSTNTLFLFGEVGTHFYHGKLNLSPCPSVPVCFSPLRKDITSPSLSNLIDFMSCTELGIGGCKVTGARKT